MKPPTGNSVSHGILCPCSPQVPLRTGAGPKGHIHQVRQEAPRAQQLLHRNKQPQRQHSSDAAAVDRDRSHRGGLGEQLHPHGALLLAQETSRDDILGFRAGDRFAMAFHADITEPMPARKEVLRPSDDAAKADSVGEPVVELVMMLPQGLPMDGPCCSVVGYRIIIQRHELRLDALAPVSGCRGAD